MFLKARVNTERARVSLGAQREAAERTGLQGMTNDGRMQGASVLQRELTVQPSRPP